MKSLTDISLIKSRVGVYTDTAENRRLHRVGEHYGHKKEPEVKGGDAIKEKIKNFVKNFTPEEFARYKRLKEEHINIKDPEWGTIKEYEGDAKRKAWRKQAVANVVEKAKKSVSGKKRAVFTLGGAASGKSSSLKIMGCAEDKMPCQLNPDEYHETPEMQADNRFYNKIKRGMGAAKLHKEASKMNKEAYKEVLTTGGDFVKDGVMGDYEKSLKDLREAIEAGYHPEIIAVTVDPDDAWDRNLSRFQHQEDKEEFSGRKVGRKAFREGHRDSTRTFIKLLTEPDAPKVPMVLFDNNVRPGEAPIKIFDSGETPAILDEERMQRFLSKADHKPLTNKFNKLMKAKEKTAITKSAQFVEVAGYKIDKNHPDWSFAKVKVDGQTLEIDIWNLLDKYRAQKLDDYFEFYTAPSFADSEAQEKRYKAYMKWGMDGKPTGIKSDEEFFDIQKQLWGKVRVTLDPDE